MGCCWRLQNSVTWDHDSYFVVTRRPGGSSQPYDGHLRVGDCHSRRVDHERAKVADRRARGVIVITTDTPHRAVTIHVHPQFQFPIAPTASIATADSALDRNNRYRYYGHFGHGCCTSDVLGGNLCCRRLTGDFGDSLGHGGLVGLHLRHIFNAQLFFKNIHTYAWCGRIKCVHF